MQLALFARRVDSKFSAGKFGKVEVTMEKCKGIFLYISVFTYAFFRLIGIGLYLFMYIRVFLSVVICVSGPIAQLEEHRADNAGVSGSIPDGPMLANSL